MATKKLNLDDGGTVYEFNDEAEYEGNTFISLKKTTRWKKNGEDKVKYQTLTGKPKHRPELGAFLVECGKILQDRAREPGEDETPF
jgi:hypothetical protein